MDSPYHLLRRMKETINIRKVVLVLVLLTGLIFLVFHHSEFLKTRSYFNDVKIEKLSSAEKEAILSDPAVAKNEAQLFEARLAPKKKLPIKGDMTISQNFTARESGLAQIRLFFHNPDGAGGKGTVRVSVCNQGGREIAEAHLSTDLIKNDAMTKFDFSGNSEAIASNEIATTLFKNRIHNTLIRKGSVYTLRIQCQDIRPSTDFDLYLCDQPAAEAESLTIDGKETEDHLYGTVQYYRFGLRPFLTLIALFLLGMFLILLPRQDLEARINRRRAEKGKPAIVLERRLLRIIFFATPFVTFLVEYIMPGASFLTAIGKLFTFRGLLNLMIIGFLWWFIYTVWNRTKYASITTIATVFGFCISNYIVLQFMGSPLTASDFANFGTGLGVAGNFLLQFDKHLLTAMTITMVWICLTLALKSQKGLVGRRRLASIALACCWFVLIHSTLLTGNTLQRHNIFVSGFKAQLNYEKNGTLLSFLATVRTSFVEKPEGYSAEAAEKILAGYTSDVAEKAKEPSEHQPNIIAIMNEAYADLRAVGDLPLSEEYMPFFKGLTKNTVHGTLHTSIFGGSTANTEFEFLTGNSVDLFPFHAIPYNSMKGADSPVPSLTRSLKEDGYGGNIAFHPGLSDSYNRNRAYPAMGFDRHISLEDLKDPEKLRDFVSDSYDYQVIREEYEAYRAEGGKAPFWLFNVTIQNHSDFKFSTGLVDEKVTITDDDLAEEEAIQYIRLMKKSDEALEELVGYFEKVGEPTVIVLFGDHQPRLGDTFYTKMLGKEEKELSTEELSRKYQVPFMIWANYDIDEETDVHLSANYLSAYLLRLIGAPMTAYDKYRMDLYEKLPVISAFFTMDEQGRVYDASDEKENPHADLLNQYRIVEYNDLIDAGNRVEEAFGLR